MTFSPKAQQIHAEISRKETKLGDLRVIAKEIKKDHSLAKELWTAGGLNPRLLSILIMDKKALNDEAIDSIFADIDQHDQAERLQLAD